MNKGDTVYSKKQSWYRTWGPFVKEKWGHYSGYESMSTDLVVRKARYTYRCSDCGKVIEKGELHGGTFYDHFCLDCVTETRPEKQFSPL